MIISVLIRTLAKAGKQACLADPKAKLYAKVNHVDNFALAMKNVIDDAMIDVISKRIDLHDVTCVDWFNRECNKEFKRIVIKVAGECYKILREEA